MVIAVAVLENASIRPMTVPSVERVDIRIGKDKQVAKTVMLDATLTTMATLPARAEVHVPLVFTAMQVAHHRSSTRVRR